MEAKDTKTLRKKATTIVHKQNAFDVEGTLSVIFKAALKPLAFGLEATSGHQTIICAGPEYGISGSASMDITLVEKPITREQIKAAAWPYYEEVVKAVVDVKKGIMAIGGEMHADEERFLLEQGSRQEDLWGINIFTEHDGPDMIEFDSMINVSPRRDNRSRSVENSDIRRRITELVISLVRPN